MKRATTALLICLVVAALSGCGDLAPLKPKSLGWLTSLEQAKAKAQAEQKLILVNFTGSDWCGWCKRLRGEVFARSAFTSYASNNFVLVEVDFPQRLEQSDDVKRANQALVERFKVEGFPTVLVLDAQGRELGRTGYVEGGPKAFIAEIKGLGENSSGAIPDNVQVDVYGGSGLRLKGISGPPEKRLALINSITLEVGESAQIRAGEQRMNVKCIAIRDRSVVVDINDSAQLIELRLSGRL